MAPTRELAQQVAVSFSKYGQNLKGLEVATLCGGQEYREQLSAPAAAPRSWSAPRAASSITWIAAA